MGINSRQVRQAGWLLALVCSGCGIAPPDADNAFEPIDPARVLIGSVQGSGHASPLLGQAVLIEAVVVRSLAGDNDDMAQEVGETLGEGNRGKVVGWFVQDEGDGDPATSDALFVLDQGYDTGLNMPALVEYTMRMGTRVRTGDRIAVHGTVVELPQADAAEQPRSSGYPVARGPSDGTLTAIAASSITLLEPAVRAVAILPTSTPPGQAANENVEGMRLSRVHLAADQPPAK